MMVGVEYEAGSSASDIGEEKDGVVKGAKCRILNLFRVFCIEEIKARRGVGKTRLYKSFHFGNLASETLCHTANPSPFCLSL